MNPPENQKDPSSAVAQRFRGFLPVIIDVETGGFNPATDALLEIAAVTIRMDEDGFIHRHETFSFHIEPFEGANIEQAALDFTGIDLDSPDRMAEPELMALTDMMQAVRRSVKENGCTRAVVVGHNAHFDLNFLNAAIERCDIKRSPFHPFSVFDTATLAGLAFGQPCWPRPAVLPVLISAETFIPIETWCFSPRTWNSQGSGAVLAGGRRIS